MKSGESLNENREMKGYFKVRRKHFWVKRFIIVKSGVLYYYKKSIEVSPRKYFNLSKCVVSKDDKDLLLDVSKLGVSILKIQFTSRGDLDDWFGFMQVSKQIEKVEVQECAFLEHQRNIDKENKQLVDQIPSSKTHPIQMQKIREIVEKDYKIVGTRGSSIYALYKPIETTPIISKKKNTKIFTIILGFVASEILRYFLGGLMVALAGLACLGYIWSSSAPEEEPQNNSRYHFKCSNIIKAGTGEVLTALYDFYCRVAWEPFLTDCSDGSPIKLTYSFNGKTVCQEVNRLLIKDSSYFYLIEKVGLDIKSLFRIEEKPKNGKLQTQIIHYGKVNNKEDPIIGNADILTCLKNYVESTTVYVNNNELPPEEKSSDEEETLAMGSSILEDENSKYYNEAYRAMKEAEEILNQPEGWEDLKLKSRFVKGYRKKAAGGLFVIRGDGIIDRTTDEIVAGLQNIERKRGYDTMFEVGHIVEQINDSTEVVYQKYKSKGPVSARDFCLVQKRFDFTGGKVVAVATSIVHSGCPETKFVRAHLFFGCHFLTPVGPNSTQDIYLIYVDIKGSVPKFIINSVQNDQAMLVENLKNFLN